MIGVLKTTVQTMFRFFPFPTETGLRAIGAPDTGSPVFVTCNFDLTVRRVTRALKGLDCYLLVAPSKGINVWCAAGGGMLNAHSITSVLKTSRIAERVNHRTLILPQLSAPGVDVTRIEEETGWHCEFGPVYARDIPAYVAAGFSKTSAMRQARFPLADRLEMAAMWATPMSIVAGIPMAFVSPSSLAGVLALIWLFSLFLFICYEPVTRHVPGPVGLVQTLLLGLVGVAGVSLYGLFLDDWSIGNIAAWGIGILVVALVLGFDLDGSSPLRAGSTVAFWGRKWPRILEVWARLGYELEQHFALRVDRDLCKGCATCVAVCPKGVFDLYHLDGRQKAWLARPAECEQCTACVKQCPEGAVLSEPPVRTFAPADV